MPIASINQDEGDKLLRMEGELHKRVVSQEKAISAVSRAIRRSRAGLKNPNRPPSGRVVRRFLLRYFLIAVGAYVIFKSSATVVYGFFAGLSLPVVGVFCEAVYELFTTLRSHS